MKIGDTVRYLNATGGGKVVRIEGDLAYVDEDGFETPVLVRECVVVGNSNSFTPPSFGPKAKPGISKDSTPVKEAPAPTKLPVIETATGDSMNITLGFEASDLRAISTSAFDAYLVNDSNYYLYVALMSRPADTKQWTLRYDGIIEPNIQEFLFDLTAAQLSQYERIGVQIIAFKRDCLFEAKRPVMVELKVDTTKFAKFHCFRPNPYFDVPVIAFDIVSGDMPAASTDVDPDAIARAMHPSPKSSDRESPKNRHRETPAHDSVIEVDLHASELFETTAGLEPADILNYQIERFSEVMKQNLNHPGQKIVFIHGKGEGVLRQAIMKELNHRFKGHDVQDASFREYGFGATQVTIRKPNNTPVPPKGKRRK